MSGGSGIYVQKWKRICRTLSRSPPCVRLGIHLQNAHYARVLYTTISNCAHGVYVDQSLDVVLKNLITVNNQGFGVCAGYYAPSVSFTNA